MSNDYVRRLYAGERAWGEVASGYRRRVRQCLALDHYDLIWLEKELLPMAPFVIESTLLGAKRFVLDLDDAVFHTYDRSNRAWVRRLLGRKLDGLMRKAALVTAGNSYLAARARSAGAAWIEQIPSTVPLTRYRAVSSRPREPGEALRVVWIGSPATVHYLALVRGAMQRAAAEVDLVLSVIGATAPSWPGVRTESVDWTESGEQAALSRGHLGIMPLADSVWEQGKCSFKLIQYMACGLPVLASPVGMNLDVVAHGSNGWLANSAEEWLEAIRNTYALPSQAAAMGRQGRDDVVKRYSAEAVGLHLAQLLYQASRQSSVR